MKRFFVFLVIIIFSIFIGFSKTALILGGGGAAGAYEIGVLKYIKENNIKFDGIYGVSVGAINSLAFLSENLSAAEELWKEIDLSKVVNVEKSHIFLNIEPLRNLLKEMVREDLIFSSEVDFGVFVFDILEMKGKLIRKKDMKPGEVVEYVIASGTLPVFGITTIRNKFYLDGGLITNFPIREVINLGYDKIVVVKSNFSPTIGDFISIISSLKYILKKRVFFIIPTEPLPTSLDFSPKYAEFLIELGYNDAKNFFEKNKFFLEK